MTAKCKISKEILLLLFAFLYVLLMASSSSPLINIHSYSSDFNIFVVMGEGWKNGAITGHDLFDNKGPLLHFIYMIGAYICPGKIGIYLLESIFMYFTLRLLLKIGYQITDSKRIIYVAIAAVLFVFVYMMSGGGTNEHFSLPFVLYPMYVIIKHIYKELRITNINALLCGVCFAVTSQIRLNNTAIIVGVCLAILYYCIRDKQFKELFRLLGMFLMGCMVIFVPLVIYFAYHDALYDMIYTSILYNIKYKQSWGGEMTTMRYVRNIVRLLSCIILPILSYSYDKRMHKKSFVFCLLISLITFLTFYSGTGYAHYYTMQLPILFLCVVLSIYLSLGWRILIIAVLCVPNALYVYRQLVLNTMLITNYYKIHKSGPYYDIYKYYEMIDNRALKKTVFDYIPESEKNSIYIINTMNYSSIFIDTPYYPVGKYFLQQSLVAKTDPIAKEDIISSFEKASPKWIVSDITIEECDVLAKYADDYQVVKDTYLNGYDSRLLIYHRIAQ